MLPKTFGYDITERAMPVRTSAQILGEGEGSLKVTLTGDLKIAIYHYYNVTRTNDSGIDIIFSRKGLTEVGHEGEELRTRINRQRSNQEERERERGIEKGAIETTLNIEQYLEVERFRAGRKEMKQYRAMA